MTIFTVVPMLYSILAVCVTLNIKYLPWNSLFCCIVQWHFAICHNQIGINTKPQKPFFHFLTQYRKLRLVLGNDFGGKY